MASETDPLGPPGTASGWSQTVEVTVDSLENAGNEPWDPVENTGLEAVDSVQVQGQTDPSNQITWNPVEERFDVIAVSDGADVVAATDIGSFQVRVSGVR